MPAVQWRQLLNKRITGYLNWKINRSQSIGRDYLNPLLEHIKNQNPDHVAVTGDLVNLSLPDEFERAFHFLQTLGEPAEVSVILGNHDAYVPGASKRAMQAWKLYTGSAMTAVQETENFPYLRVIDNVALIGCNSAEATFPFMATGYFRKQQQAALAKLLKQSKHLCRVVMIHHPPVHGATPFHKRLVGIDRFQDVIAKHGAELVLHGHTHLADTHMIPGPHKAVPVIGVPAAGNGPGNSKPPGRYNLFEINGTMEHWTIHWNSFGFSDDSLTIEQFENRPFY